MLITYLCHIKYKLIPFFSQEIIHHGHQQCKQMHIMLFVFSHITRCFLHIFLYVPHTMHSVIQVTVQSHIVQNKMEPVPSLLVSWD